MEVYNNVDKTVYKYIHDDGSETAIKLTNTEKYSIVISCSVGCNVGCTFCYLTIKKCPYYRLTALNIFNNVKEAFEYQIKETPDIVNKQVKLCYMGMGDAFSEFRRVCDSCKELLSLFHSPEVRNGVFLIRC